MNTPTSDRLAAHAAAIPFVVPASRWDHAHAAMLSPAELLLYRLNLLGSDLTVTNFGGGNTSAKLIEADPLTGAAAEVLLVKGSGGDIGSMASPRSIRPSCSASKRTTAARATTTRWSVTCRTAPSI